MKGVVHYIAYDLGANGHLWLELSDALIEWEAQERLSVERLLDLIDEAA